VPFTLQALTAGSSQCLLSEEGGIPTLVLEDLRGRMDTVADLAGVVVDMEVPEVATAAVVADLWALLLHLETGDEVSDPHMVAVVEAVLEVDEDATSGLLQAQSR
jgi:hypothetical protein